MRRLEAPLFADTSGFGNFFIAAEPFYDLSGEIIGSAIAAKTRIYTTNFVLSEFTATMNSPLRVPRVRAIAIMRSLRAASWLTIVAVTPEMENDAYELFYARPDKAYSLCDCASFVVMRALGVADALTQDRHFAQEGFVPCLAPPEPAV